MTDSLSPLQFSAYDERPDPKRPGQQGVLFRKEAPARGTPDERRGIHPGRWGDPVDDRRAKGRATGLVPDDGILFHGTSSRLRPGSMIMPGREPNFEAYHEGRRLMDGEHGLSHDVNREYAFATPHLHDAYRYARVSQEVQSEKRDTRRRAFVYEVQPTGPVQIDHEEEDQRNSDSDEPPALQSRHGYRVLRAHNLTSAAEAYRSYMEDDLGSEPGSYPFAAKQREDWY